MKRIVVLTSILFCLALLAPAAQADTHVCFDWSCNSTTKQCTFDASCSSASPFIWKYDFDWGDGSSTGLTGNPNQTHSYPSTPYPVVELTVYPWGDDVQSHSCQITVYNVFSPPLPTSGRCEE